jgi:hypothetical protein
MNTNNDPSDTVAGEGTIIPGGPAPLVKPEGDAAAEDRPLMDRLERDPSNLGQDIRDEGDVVFPTPDPGETQL